MTKRGQPKQILIPEIREALRGSDRDGRPGAVGIPQLLMCMNAP